MLLDKNQIYDLVAARFPEDKIPTNSKDKAIWYQDKGIMYKRLGLYQETVECYKKSIELIPDNGMVYYNLGKVLYLLDEREKAVRAYTLALKYNVHIDAYNLCLHIGHALIDEEPAKIKNYKLSISGKPSDRDFVYDIKCVEAGKKYCNDNGLKF